MNKDDVDNLNRYIKTMRQMLCLKNLSLGKTEKKWFIF